MASFRVLPFFDFIGCFSEGLRRAPARQWVEFLDVTEQEENATGHSAGHQEEGSVKFKKRKEPFGYGRRRQGNQSDISGGPWTEQSVKRLLSNPFYCGFCVDPKLTLKRPLEGGYIQTAVQIIQEVGAGAFLRNVLEKLKDSSYPLPERTTVPDDRFCSAIWVHPYFAEPHPAIVTEEDFIEAGIVGIGESGAEAYLEGLLENLKGNWV